MRFIYSFGRRLCPGLLALGLLTQSSVVTAAESSLLSLQEAMERALTAHPDLKLLESKRIQFEAGVERAAQRPQLEAGLEVENALGTGDVSGVHAAEVTVSLGATLERGGKREARRTFAATRLDAWSTERDIKRLDLLAEVERRYLDVAQAQAAMRLHTEDVSHRIRTVEATAHRVQAGAAHESTLLTAEAARIRAELELAEVEQTFATAYRRLSALWGERNATPRATHETLRSLPVLLDFETLASSLERAPELQRFAGETRLRDAQLHLAQSARNADIAWKIGVRRLQDSDDWAAVAGLSLPLGSARRAAAEIRSAQAEVDALGLEKQSSELTLYATLSEAHGQYVTAKTKAERLEKELLPTLAKAAAAAENAYRAGALSYLEWTQLQSEWLDAQRARLAAMHAGWRASIEIRRLTGNAFLPSNAERTALSSYRSPSPPTPPPGREREDLR